MKTQLIVLFILMAGATYLFQNQSVFEETQNGDESLFQEYVSWKQEHGKNTQGREDQYRFAQFKENYIFIQHFNAKETTSLRLGLTLFADLSNQEYIETHLNTIEEIETAQETQNEQLFTYQNLAATINWGAKGIVTPVENQGSCGSCWAFSAKGALEGIHALKTSNLEVFSASQLVDCSTANLACKGGWTIKAFAYTQVQGIQSQASYPYASAKSGLPTPCTYNSEEATFKNAGQLQVKPINNQAAIQTALQKQPLSMNISGSSAVFQLYKTGVLNNIQCGTTLNHAVLLTGYVSGVEVPYWIIKNSWGTTWGDKGYVNIIMNGDGPGICGIQQYVAYPTL